MERQLDLGTPDISPEDFRKVLQDLVNNKVVTKKKLAEIMGIGASTLSAWTNKAGQSSYLPKASVIPLCVSRLVTVLGQQGEMNVPKHFNVPTDTLSIKSEEISDAYVHYLELLLKKIDDKLVEVDHALEETNRMRDAITLSKYEIESDREKLVSLIDSARSFHYDKI